MISCENVDENSIKDHNNRNTNPERSESSPSGKFKYDPRGQYHVKNKSTASIVCHGISAITLERTKTFQEYVLEGPSRASYRSLLPMYCGIISCTRLLNNVKRRKIENS
jgi:hypothetical protein